MTTYAHRIVSESIDIPAAAVYDYARQVENLPEWAAGLATAVQRDGDHWFAASPMGRIRIDMAPRNDFGVLDHDVTTPDGTTFHNAMRVTPSGDGCVLHFVVLRMPDAGDAEFERDCGLVAADLRSLGRRVATR